MTISLLFSRQMLALYRFIGVMSWEAFSGSKLNLMFRMRYVSYTARRPLGSDTTLSSRRGPVDPIVDGVELFGLRHGIRWQCLAESVRTASGRLSSMNIFNRSCQVI